MQNDDLLAQCFLFKHLDRGELHLLAEASDTVQYAAHDIIFDDHTVGDCMYFIRYGTVAVEKDDEEIARLGQGSHFGEVALLDGGNRSATVTAVEHTELLKLDRGRFEALLASDTKLASDVYHTLCVYLCGRLRRTTEQLAFFKDLSSHHHAD